MTVKTVSEFLGVRIDYYIETDFAGFSKIIDTLGGVEINVEKDMQYTDVAGGLYIDIKAGPQVLDGKTALEYVRYRDYLGDVALVDPNYEIYGGRVERQRKFILAVIKEVLQPKTLLKLPRLLRQIWDAVDTNAPWTTALKLAFAADRFTLDRIETAIVPGTSEQINGAWYWIADSERTKQVVDWIIHGVPLPLTAEVLNGTGVRVSPLPRPKLCVNTTWMSNGSAMPITSITRCRRLLLDRRLQPTASRNWPIIFRRK